MITKKIDNNNKNNRKIKISMEKFSDEEFLYQIKYMKIKYAML